MAALGRAVTAPPAEYAKRRIVQLAEYTEEALYFASITDDPEHAADLHVHASLYATEARLIAGLVACAPEARLIPPETQP